jgi:uncharacterized cofD-like protein
MSLGNLAIAAMIDMEGNFERGIRVLSTLLNIQGKVLPPTLANCHLCAEMADGEIREGEVAVREPGTAPIARPFLKPEAPPACEEAVQDIMSADIVVIGPGSLFTSVIPNVLVPGIREALKATEAVKIYVSNIVTQPGQTDGLTGADHVRALLDAAGPGAVDYVLFNSSVPADEVLERYRSEGAEIVLADGGLEEFDVGVYEADLVEDLDEKRVLWEKQDLLRHHPDKLADAICRIYAGLQPQVAASLGTSVSG